MTKGPPLPDRFKRGDWVHVTYEGRTVDATVTMASDNGRSLVINFETILGGHVGVMMVACDEGGCRSLIEGKPVVITPALHDH